ncbi:MAG: transcription repressor NadR [Clostridiales bacterium]|nr:transcription repressor NadR [Clostridiales bacterium]
MNAAERRQAVLSLLQTTQTPQSAGALARRFSVSRQIIVGDVALLRAAGHAIDATPRGYLLRRPAEGLRHTVVCCHDKEGMEQELLLCVDNGCTVLDVSVEHPLYGHLTGQLQLSSRYDVQQFMEQSRREQAAPLSCLTDGIHLHTLLCPDENAYQRVVAALRDAGMLVDEEQ